MRKSVVMIGAAALLAGSAAFADTMSPMTTIPTDSYTVTDWYKQDVYDPNNNKIGSVSDVLVAPNGSVTALIVGVGGFLGVEQKDVAVNFSAIKETMQNNKIRLTMNATKDQLKQAPGFKYDSQSTSWVPDTSTNSRMSK
jgi:sporulation protein YlmC with PRC-barrel domain